MNEQMAYYIMKKTISRDRERMKEDAERLQRRRKYSFEEDPQEPPKKVFTSLSDYDRVRVCATCYRKYHLVEKEMQEELGQKNYTVAFPESDPFKLLEFLKQKPMEKPQKPPKVPKKIQVQDHLGLELGRKLSIYEGQLVRQQSKLRRAPKKSEDRIPKHQSVLPVILTPTKTPAKSPAKTPVNIPETKAHFLSKKKLRFKSLLNLEPSDYKF